MNARPAARTTVESRARLARWPDQHGRWAGSWLVRALPGVALRRGDGGWSLQPGWIGNSDTSLGQTWGEGYDIVPARRLLRAHGLLDQHFPTRARALAAVEELLCLRPPWHPGQGLEARL